MQSAVIDVRLPSEGLEQWVYVVEGGLLSKQRVECLCSAARASIQERPKRPENPLSELRRRTGIGVRVMTVNAVLCTRCPAETRLRAQLLVVGKLIAAFGQARRIRPEVIQNVAVYRWPRLPGRT